MGDVGIGHDQVVIAYAGKRAALRRAAIDGDELADGVVIANFEARRFPRIAQILWREADRGKRKKAVAAADLRGTFQSYVRKQLATFPQLDMGTDHAIGANLAGRGNFVPRVDDGGGMGRHGGGLGHSIITALSRPSCLAPFLLAAPACSL